MQKIILMPRSFRRVAFKVSTLFGTIELWGIVKISCKLADILHIAILSLLKIGKDPLHIEGDT